MVFVTGPRFSGKKAFVRAQLQVSEEKFDEIVAYDILDSVGKTTDINGLAAQLCAYRVVILPEMGSGVIPMEESERLLRENCGALAQLLAKEATVVIRVVCGLPQVLKGSLEEFL